MKYFKKKNVAKVLCANYYVQYKTKKTDSAEWNPCSLLSIIKDSL